MIGNYLQVLAIQEMPLILLKLRVTRHAGAPYQRVSLTGRPSNQRPLLCAAQLVIDQLSNSGMVVRAE